MNNCTYVYFYTSRAIYIYIYIYMMRVKEGYNFEIHAKSWCHDF